MVEKKVVTLGFTKETPQPSLTSLTQQSRGQLQGLYHKRAKGPNRNLVGVPHLTLLNKRERISVGSVVGSHQKEDCPNPPQMTTSEPNPS
jgi:hypothetical protein